MTPMQLDQTALRLIEENPEVVGALVAVKHQNGRIELRWINLTVVDVSFLTDLAKVKSFEGHKDEIISNADLLMGSDGVEH